MVTHWLGSGWLSSAVRGIMGRLKVMVTMALVGTSLAPALGRVRRMEGGGAVLKLADMGAAIGAPPWVLALALTATV